MLILGCHPGDCHYKEGNYKALRRHKMTEKVLSQLNIEKGRIRLDWVSASEADKFVQVVKDMREQLIKLGPFNQG